MCAMLVFDLVLLFCTAVLVSDDFGRGWPQGYQGTQRHRDSGVSISSKSKIYYLRVLQVCDASLRVASSR